MSGKNQAVQYILEHANEAERLEKQARLPVYDVNAEFAALHLKAGEKVLDAGCGSGVVTRYLACRFPETRIEGCDFSEDRLEHARRLVPLHNSIRYFGCDLKTIPAEANFYDAITCRYVMEHLSDPLAVAQEFHRILKSGGVAHVVDFDGLVFNLYPLSPKLHEMIGILTHSIPVDLYVGRKITTLLSAAGFRNIAWEIQSFALTGKALEDERVLNEERIDACTPFISKALGSDLKAHEFKRRYLEEMTQPGSSLFYNKFLVSASK